MHGPVRGTPAPPRTVVAAVLAALALLAGCASTGYAAAGPWRPQVEGQPPAVAPPMDPSLPPPADPNQPPQPAPQPGAEDPNVVASGLDTPWGLAQLPDGSALVGERRTGRILQVFPDRSAPRELMTVPGLDASGDGGLLGLAISPAYTEDSLVYAYATTATDNRILRFTLGGVPQAIFTGIPKGPVNNGGRIAFGADESLYVGTGDTGNPALARDLTSLAGKVLRLDIFGRAAADNPNVGSPIFTSGNSNVTGLCFDGADRLFAAESDRDEFHLLEAGVDYGWSAQPQSTGTSAAYPDAGLGGCGILARTAFIAALDGQRVWISVLDGNGQAIGQPEEFLHGRYGRLRTVVADPAGALWITTSNRDGQQPAADDDRVLRVLPPSDAGGGVS